MERDAIGRRGLERDGGVAAEVGRDALDEVAREGSSGGGGAFDFFLGREVNAAFARSAVGAEEEGEDGAGEGDGAGEEAREEVGIGGEE